LFRSGHCRYGDARFSRRLLLLAFQEHLRRNKAEQELGKALGIDVTSAAAAILDAGDAQHIIDQVKESIAKLKGGKSEQ